MKPAITSRQCGLLKLLMLSTTMICAGQTQAAPQGELDASFGEQGRMRIEIAGTRFGSTMLRQPSDGKPLFPGLRETAGGGQDFAVLRLNPDGSTDTGFGTDGIATAHFDTGPAAASRLVVQPDGKILVVGSRKSPETLDDFAIVRLNTDGTLDTTFGQDGFRTLELGGHEFVSDVVLLPAGGFVVAGTSDEGGDQDIAFARFDASGDLDTTFGNGGVLGTTRIGVEGRTDEVFSLLQQADGKLVACGIASDYSQLTYVGDMLTIRLTADGLADPTFGTDGISRIHGGPDYAVTTSCVEMPDETIILAGYRGSPGVADPMLARLTSDGMLDTTFGNAGFATFTLDEDAWINAITRLSDGTLAVAGTAKPLANTDIPTYLFLAHLHADTGLLEATFGHEGVTIVDFGHSDQASTVEGRALIELPDGKLLAAAQPFGSTLALARVDRAATGSAGIVGLVAQSLTAAEGVNLAVTVQRTGGSKGVFSVDYTTTVDTATAPADFTETSGTLTWLDGEMGPKSITIPLEDDGDRENAERFLILLSGSSGPLSLDKTTVEIEDNDPATPPPPAPQNVERGGSGGLGIETLLMLGSICALAVRRRFATGRQPLH